MFARSTIPAIAVAWFCLGLPTTAPAQSYPNRPVRMIVPFPPGGGSDLLGRTIAQELTGILGQQVVVENRGGAQGCVGTAAVAKSKPDGYTVLLSFVGTLAMNPWIYREPGYDPVKDFSHVTYAAAQPPLVVVNPRVPVKNLKELAAIAKAKPQQLSFASGSSSGHLTGELFNLIAGIRMVHIPYKGGGPAMIDVVAGNVDLLFASPAASIPMVRAGKLRAIAVAGPSRLAGVPDVLTAKESGFPDFDVNGWYAVSAPANLPRDIIVRLNTDIGRALSSAALKDRLATEGYDPRGSTPEEITELVKVEYERWGKVVKAAGIKPE
ncbi:MAG: Bug family tripartite tricarboxylate transporter substrate binding protein [Burkholderiales bacterium]